VLNAGLRADMSLLFFLDEVYVSLALPSIDTIGVLLKLEASAPSGMEKMELFSSSALLLPLLI
jgi:hypothetical protein